MRWSRKPPPTPDQPAVCPKPHIEEVLLRKPSRASCLSEHLSGARAAPGIATCSLALLGSGRVLTRVSEAVAELCYREGIRCSDAGIGQGVEGTNGEGGGRRTQNVAPEGQILIPPDFSRRAAQATFSQLSGLPTLWSQLTPPRCPCLAAAPGPRCRGFALHPFPEPEEDSWEDSVERPFAPAGKVHMLWANVTAQRDHPILPGGLGDPPLSLGPGSPARPQTCVSLSTGFRQLLGWTCPRAGFTLDGPSVPTQPLVAPATLVCPLQ